MPIVSVIIPTYKHRDLVLATLASVFAQTLTDYEVIVVNDGSPDDTAAVLRPLAEAGRIRYIEQENQGQGAARNRGLAEAQGEFVALLDDDDLWPPDKLAWQVAALRAHPDAVMVYGFSQSFGEAEGKLWPDENGPGEDVLKAFLKENRITSPGQTLIRAEALQNIGGFDPKLWGVDDWDLYIRLAAHGSVLFENSLGLHYRLHSANASKNLWQMYQNVRLLLDKHKVKLQQYEMYHSGRQNGRNLFANEYVQLAQCERQAGEWTRARRMLWTAARIRPGIVLKRRFVLPLEIGRAHV